MKQKNSIHKIGLVACCGEKLTHAAPAKELYQSALFKKSRQFVEQTCDEWAILSAKYGLVTPEICIDPYDRTLANMNFDERFAWSKMVRNQFEMIFMSRIPKRTIFVILAGQHYRQPFDESFPFDWEAPLAGVAIGKQLQWLTRQNKLQGWRTR